MDFEMGQKADTLRGELRELVNNNVPEHFLGAFTDNPADLETAQAFCRLLAERNLLCLSWPEEFGGARRRCGSRRWSARRCGRTTNLAAPSTWG